MPGRAARWRLRHAGMTFADRVGELVTSGERYDAVFSTGLCSLSDFRAAAPPSIRNLPHVLYMHENQAAYPVSEAVDRRTIDRDAHLAFTNLGSVMAADRVLWNSRYNLESFVEEMEIILRRAPESVSREWTTRLAERSCVAWPPIEPVNVEGGILHNPDTGDYPEPTDGERTVVRVAWPHRWEHDKGCDELLNLIEEHLDDETFDFRWTILGDRYERMPAAMHAILDRHQASLDHAGFIPDRAGYLKALAGCDWVTSTARHEFFGIAVTEAMLAGCLPWLPNRLSYPELIPEEYRGMNPWNAPSDLGAVRTKLRSHLEPSRADIAVGRIEDEIRGLIDD